MFALGPREVVAGGDALLDAGQRHPVRHPETRVAERRVRETTLADIRAVQSGNPELVAEIGAKIVAVHALPLPLITDNLIQQYVRRNRVGVADRSELDQRIAEAGVRAGGRS